MNPNWIDLDGVVNMRDLGGTITGDGRVIQPLRLIRSDNLNDLKDPAINYLTNVLRVSDVVDLRTPEEHSRYDHLPIEGKVNIHFNSLYPKPGTYESAPDWDLLTKPGVNEPNDHNHVTARHYLIYFLGRPDSLISTMRTVGSSPGATVINCAAGKDRTGSACALILKTIGVSDEDVIADYAASNEKIPAILDRLGIAATLGSAQLEAKVQSQATTPKIMELLLGYISSELGGLDNWLDMNGWNQNDQAALETKLLT